MLFENQDSDKIPQGLGEGEWEGDRGSETKTQKNKEHIIHCIYTLFILKPPETRKHISNINWFDESLCNYKI